MTNRTIETQGKTGDRPDVDSLEVQTIEIQRGQEQPATTVAEWQERIAQSLVEVTAVRLETTAAGLSVVLETTAELPVPQTRSSGNALIVDIPNAVLKEEFQQANPIAGIARVSVTALPGDQVRVAITGSDAPPTAQVSTAATGLTLAIAIGTTTEAEQKEEELEIVVTGEQEEGYAVPNASVGTRTDARILEIPQSIQVIPQQVLEDPNAIDANEALRNAGGTRGFGGLGLNDGFSSVRNLSLRNEGQDLTNIEQIEVLQGPASVLYGSRAVGGIVNFTAKQPQPEPRYKIEASIGNFNFYRPAIDFTSPLNKERTILYRLTASYQNSGAVTDFAENQEWAVFPTLSFKLGERTELTLEGGYEAFSRNDYFRQAPARGTLLDNPLGDVSLNLYYGEPDYDLLNYENIYVGYRFEHEFSENWSLSNRFRATFDDFDLRGIRTTGELLDDNRTIEQLGAFTNQRSSENYELQTQPTGKVQTGIVKHDLLLGVDLRRNIDRDRGVNFAEGDHPDLDIFDPQYGFPVSPVPESTFLGITTSDTIGVYTQNLLSIGKRVKILLGGRFDWFFQTSEARAEGEAETESYNSENAFTPRN